MRLVFWGSPEFAVPSLYLLAKEHSISLAVTQPDKPAGRNLRVVSPAVKTVAQQLGLPVYQPQDLKAAEVVEKLKQQDADLFVVVSYGKILPKNILNLPKKLSLNLHASILPLFRGPAPINWSLLTGQPKTGVSIMKMNEYMDRGDVMLTKEIPILDNDDAMTLFAKLADLGAGALCEAVRIIAADKAVFTAQDESKATYAPALKKENGKIDWAKPSIEVRNHIRGMAGWPSAWTSYKGKKQKVFKCRIMDEGKEYATYSPGTIVELIKGEGIAVKTASGAVLLEELQPESSRRMTAVEFLSGHPLSINEKMG